MSKKFTAVCERSGAPFRLPTPAEGTEYRCIRCQKRLTGNGRPQYVWCGNTSTISPSTASESDYGAEPPTLPEQGQTIGRYQILEEIGRGGMGVVYRARDAELGRDVALKVLSRAVHPNNSHLERFRREAESIARANVPGVIRVLDQGVDQGLPWIALEFIDGTSIASVLADAGALPAREAVRMVRQVALTLARIHRLDIAHRDLKPSNVVVDALGTPYLIDFGIAATEGAEDPLTIAGQVLGTPGFMAPEQALGAMPSTDWTRADIYGLGALLHACLTGEPPKRQGFELILDPALPPRLHKIIARATALDPADRYTSAEAFADALQKHLDGKITQPTPTPSPRHRLRWQLPAASLALALAAILLWPASETADPAWLSRAQDEIRQLRSEGSDDAADAVMQAFVADPRHTTLVHRAWMDEAERALGRDHAARAFDAYALASVAAISPEDEAQALTRFAQLAASRWQWDRYLAAVRELEDAGLASTWRDSEASQIALLRGQFDDATVPPWAHRLSRQKDLDHAHLRAAIAGSLHTDNLPKGTLQEAFPFWKQAGQVTGLGTQDGDQFVLSARHNGSWSTVLRTASRPPVSFAPVGERVFRGTGDPDRAFLVDDATGSRLAHPASDDPGLYTIDMEVADFDRDGEPELLITTGPDGSGGLELFELDEPLRRIATLRGTFYTELAVVPERPDTVLVAREFPLAATRDPQAGPNFGGIHVLRYREAGFESIQYIAAAPAPEGGSRVHWFLASANLDNDGRSDFVARYGHAQAANGLPEEPAGILVLHQQPTGEFSVHAIDLGGDLEAVWDFDGDGLDELVISGVHGAEGRIVGLGSVPSATRETPPPWMATVPSQLVSNLRYLRLGLHDLSAVKVVEFARSVNTPEAWRVAAQSIEVSQDFGSAAAAWREAAYLTGESSDLRAAYEASLRYGDPELSLDLARQMRTAPKALASLVALVEPQHRVSTTFDNTDGWRLDSVAATHRSRDRVVEIHAVADSPPALFRQLTRESDAIGFDAEFDLVASGWGANVHIGLQPVGGTARDGLGFTFADHGHDDTRWRSLSVDVADGNLFIAHALEPNVQRRYRYRVQARTGVLGHGTQWVVWLDGKEVGRTRTDVQRLSGRDWQMFVQGQGLPGVETVVEIKSLTAIGFEPAATPRPLTDGLAEVLRDGAKSTPGALSEAPPGSLHTAIRRWPLSSTRALTQILGPSEAIRLAVGAWARDWRLLRDQPRVTTAVADLNPDWTADSLVDIAHEPHVIDLLAMRGVARWRLGRVLGATSDLDLASQNARGIRCVEVCIARAEIASTQQKPTEKQEFIAQATACDAAATDEALAASPVL